jgi:dynein regulatory complex subunit 2
MLDKNLDEANNQYQIAIRNHLIHIDTLLSVQSSRIQGLMEEFRRDVTILEDEYLTERQEMEQTHQDHLKELNDMIETVKEEDRRKSE